MDSKYEETEARGVDRLTEAKSAIKQALKHFNHVTGSKIALIIVDENGNILIESKFSLGADK